MNMIEITQKKLYEIWPKPMAGLARKSDTHEFLTMVHWIVGFPLGLARHKL